MAIDLRALVREVPDFPQPGVGFKDISPLLANPEGLQQTIVDLAAWGKTKEPDLVVGAEARGFILGAAIAREIGCGFVPARRPGKLPPETVERHLRARVRRRTRSSCTRTPFRKGARVLIHDDVLATGGTVEAIGGLIEQLGGDVVGVGFIIDLTFLNGRSRLSQYEIHSLIEY